MRKYRETLAFTALALVVIGTLLFAIFEPKWVVERVEGSNAFSGMVQTDKLKAENDVRTVMVQALAGAFFLFTALFTWKGFRLSRQGQITERFSRAVDQLGKENEASVRVGAVLSLDRVARESKADRATIANLLAVHIRSKDRVTTSGPRRSSANRTSPLGLEPDAAMALIVLARIHRLGVSEVVSGWKYSSHRYADLRGINLRGADLHGAYLADVDLSMADLSNAVLSLANLGGAHFYKSILRNANLEGVNSKVKKLRPINLERADLRGAIAKGARFESGNLRGARFGVQGSKGADLGGAVLKSAKADGVWLEGVEMPGADLSNADLPNAHLRGANLAGADLRGTDFTHAGGLESARLAGAKVSGRTQPPYEGFDWQAAGAKLL
ncbi:pentapeptide repeat-containing protein [Streptomyces sp. NPDC055966]|uniref:pentapeptide repeat-containing protein n=1 Tax=Streptomyces sp. NPDC055966 TaxID=3345669 RepID=UPI0035E3A706